MSKNNFLIQKSKPWLKVAKILAIFFGTVAVGYTIFYLVMVLATFSRIHIDDDSSWPNFQLSKIGVRKLQGESDNRVNILLAGIGGSQHPGGQLADTIILASLNPQDKKIALLSIPRDLYVPLPKPLVGFDKINAAHALGERDVVKTGGGLNMLEKTVSEVFNQPIHYVVSVDFEGFKKLVDVVGGITISVEKAIYDPYFPAKNMVDYEPFSIKAGQQTLNGEIALKYVRTRYTTSDFDRARRQQQILQAIKEKAFSLNIVANPKKIAEIAKIIGDKLKTDLQVWEAERLFSITKDVTKEKIITKVIDNGPGGPLVSSSEGGYYLKPKDGNYQELKQIAKNIFEQPALAEENAKIEIVNASNQNGLGSKIAENLKSYGLAVNRISKQSTNASSTVIYDATNGRKPETLAILKTKLKNSTVVIIPPNQLLQNTTADFVIIIGEDQSNGTS